MVKPHRLVAQVVSQAVSGWSFASNERAVALARASAVECSRRTVERAEVSHFLEALAAQPSYSLAT